MCASHVTCIKLKHIKLSDHKALCYNKCTAKVTQLKVVSDCFIRVYHCNLFFEFKSGPVIPGPARLALCTNK